MKNALSYRGYYGSVEFSDEDNVFFGRIIGITDRITFEGDNVQALRNDFQESVDEYIASCQQLGVSILLPNANHTLETPLTACPSTSSWV